MNLATGLMLYGLLWWVVFFMILPIGNRTPDEVGERAEPGHAESAPVKPRLWLKTAITTIVTGLIWGAIYLAVAYDLLNFRAFMQG